MGFEQDVLVAAQRGLLRDGSDEIDLAVIALAIEDDSEPTFRLPGTWDKTAASKLRDILTARLERHSVGMFYDSNNDNYSLYVRKPETAIAGGSR